LLGSSKLLLHFNGVDYIAKVFVNNKFVGEHTGLFGSFEFDIHSYVHTGKNLLEIKVYNDAIMMGDNFFTGPHRKFGKKLAACGGPGWNAVGGWTNCPPGFGIWQDCYLEKRADVFINDIYVRPLLQQSIAVVSIEVPVSAKDVSLSYSLYGQNFKATINKKRMVDKKDIRIRPLNDRFNIWTFNTVIAKKNLRLWSPDAPWLYQIQVELDQHGKTVDAVKKQFGMRSFEQSTSSVPTGRFYLNGQEIKLRGANMMGNIMQCVMRKDWRQLENDILLAKIAGMNFWRMTQQPCQEEAYDYFDKLGLMAQTDMPAFNGYRKDVVRNENAQFVELLRLVRSHPSNIMISYLNEPDFSKPMMLSRAGHQQLFYGFDSVAQLMNPGQVCKWVEGDYINLSPRFSDDHDYDIWYGNGIRKTYFGSWFDTRKGWMYGCGEFGAEGLDDIEFMKKNYPKTWLQSNDGKWNPKIIPGCQTPTVGAKWLVLKDSSMVQWVTQSRIYQQWAIRLFTEALRRDDNLNSFAVHLLIDAWPAGWLKSLMDADRQAKPAYFAYRNALRPVAVNLRPDAFYGFSADSSRIAVFVCNDEPYMIKGANLRYQVLQNDRVLSAGTIPVTQRASHVDFKGYLKFKLPNVQKRQSIKVQVGLFDAKRQLINNSDYDIDVFPATDKGKKLDRPGGYRQRLIAH
ncbi:glycoside hydrolase family 2 protein, partial [Arachidicoccus sp.]|uniref:glycoside hydrolase family 2 protein n=1 Tax=Arachidicoccus sp. TaxID=1872624 RepID=UPI003D1C922B